MKNITKHLEQMMKPYREIEKMTEPIRKMQEQILSSTLALQKNLEQPLLDFQKSFENINKIYTSIPKFQNPILEHLKTFKEIGERIKEYAEKTPDNFLLIAQHGWFIDLESEQNLPTRVAYKIKENELKTAYDLLIEYYKENLDLIFEKLNSRHPKRKEILTQILKAIDNKNHSLLIPSVLTQVDGICFDFTKRKFFIKEKENKYLPQVTSELEKSAGIFLYLYLSPLQNQTPIMVREKDIPKFPCHLNRHEVLHGIRVDYGTETNSLKVISLLKYVSDLLTDLDKKTLSNRDGGHEP
ncbi:MAG: hypothetical protein WD431_09475 [Cyclobacteriaceae bacterium]